MKVCLLGYDERFYWPGSATLKIQRNVHKYLNLNAIKADLFISSESKNYISVLFEPLKFKTNLSGTVISGGVIPFLLYLRKARYDIIHAIVTRSYMVLVTVFSAAFGVKTCTTFHDNLIFPNLPQYNFHTLKLFFIKWILSKTSNMLWLYNQDDAKIFNSKYPHKKVFLIRNGIEDIFFELINEGKNRVRFLFAGGTKEEYKGYDFLMNALRKGNIDLQLLICGAGEVQNLNKNNLGELSPDQFRRILPEILTLVIPSRYDSFNITALESMASGTPVIITNRCGVTKYLQDGSGCFIINYGDEESLVKKIEVLFNDIDSWHKMSADARITAKNFVWNSVIQDYINLYSTMLNHA